MAVNIPGFLEGFVRNRQAAKAGQTEGQIEAAEAQRKQVSRLLIDEINRANAARTDVDIRRQAEQDARDRDQEAQDAAAVKSNADVFRERYSIDIEDDTAATVEGMRLQKLEEEVQVRERQDEIAATAQAGRVDIADRGIAGRADAATAAADRGQEEDTLAFQRGQMEDAIAAVTKALTPQRASIGGPPPPSELERVREADRIARLHGFESRFDLQTQAAQAGLIPLDAAPPVPPAPPPPPAPPAAPQGPGVGGQGRRGGAGPRGQGGGLTDEQESWDAAAAERGVEAATLAFGPRPGG